MPATLQTAVLPQPSATAPRSGSYSLPLAYLRGFLTLLVVGHHASLAYFPKAPPVATSLIHNPRWWAAFPVVDKNHWSGFLFTVLFNDIFVMALFFLLSGLFTWKSLQRRGIQHFLRERMLRLGIPLVFFSLLSPVGYFPAYLQSRTHDGFWHEWLSLGVWPSGPIWFIGVLLALDLLIAGIFRSISGSIEGLSRKLSRVTNPPAMAAILLVLTSAAYIPLGTHLNHYEIFSWGPFFVQKVRVLLYPLFFLTGVVLGTAGVQQGLLQHQGRLAKQWLAWLLAAPSCFVFMQGLYFLSHRIWNPPMWGMAIDFGFCLSCVVSSFAALAFFLHFVRKERPLLTSLAACAYGIYLMHYFFVSWLQYGLLSVSAPGWLKGVLVFWMALILSWSLVHTLRKIPAVARLI